MNLTVKKYAKIVSLAKKNNFSIFEILTNYGLFSGDRNLFKTLKIFELINLTKNTKGDIIELGIHKGNTSLLIKKILDINKIKKKLYLLDHFKGLVHYGNKDPKSSKKFYKKYKSSKKMINNFLKFFNFKNVFFINKDATKINSKLFKKKKFCLAYFDMDLYDPTFNALKAIDSSIVNGGIIVFDEGYKKLWGEKKAIEDFLKINKKYKYIMINKNRQPDVYLKKIK